MNKPHLAWTWLAALQAAAILWLGWLAFGEAEIAAGSSAPPASVPATAVPSSAPAPNVPVALITPDAAEAPTAEAGLASGPATATTTLVYGEVRPRTGAPSRWTAYLNLYRGEATKPLANATLVQSPQFAWPALAPDTYRMTVRSDGMRELAHTFVVPNGLAELRLDLVLEPSWQLKVLLMTPAGEPLHEALAKLAKERPSLQGLREHVSVVAAWRRLPDNLPPSDLRETPFTVARWQDAREPGRRTSGQLPARYAGQLELPETRAAVIGAVSGNAVLVQTAVEAGQAEVTLVVDPAQLLQRLGTVRLQVVDAATQQPIATAKVGLNDAQSWRQPSPVDAEGRIEFRDLRPGQLRLSIDAAGRQGPSGLVEVAPGTVTDLGPIAVVAPFVLRVRPTGRSGDQELRGNLTPLDAPGHPSLRPAAVPLGAARAGQDGAVAGDLQATVTPGRYELRLTGAGGARVEVDTQKLGEMPLVVELQPEAALRLDPSGLAEPVRLVIQASNGQRILDRWITWKAAWEQRLMPGTYTIERTTFEGVTQREELSVPAGGASYVLR